MHRARRAIRDARRFASLTIGGLGSKPSGTSSERKTRARASLSDRRAREKVLQGGAPCSHRTLPFLIRLRSSLKCSSIERSKCLLRPLSSGFNKSWGSYASKPSLRTAAVKPPAPANNSKKYIGLSFSDGRTRSSPLAAGRRRGGRSRSPQAGGSPRGGWEERSPPRGMGLEYPDLDLPT